MATLNEDKQKARIQELTKVAHRPIDGAPVILRRGMTQEEWLWVRQERKKYLKELRAFLSK